MNIFKTISLALMLIILSATATGLQANETSQNLSTQSNELQKKEIPVKMLPFALQFINALKSKDMRKVMQLLQDNPKIAKAFQKKLVVIAKNSGDKDKQQLLALASLIEKLQKTIGLHNIYPELDSLQDRGKRAFYDSDYETALKKWQEGLKKAQELGDKRYISQFLGNIGLTHNKSGDYLKALDYYQQALVIHTEINDKRGEEADLTNIGSVYKNLSDYPKALNYYQQVLVIHKETGNKRRQEGTDLTNIGLVYVELGNYQTALDYYQQALVIDKEIDDKYGEGVDLNSIAVVYKNLGDYTKVLDYYQQVLAIYKEIGNEYQKRTGLINVGLVYSKLGNYPKSLYYYQQALETETNKKTTINLPNIDVMTDYQNALKHFYKQTLEIYQELVRGERKDLNDIGVAYDNLGNYPKALDLYYQQALEIHKKINHKHSEGKGFNNIGMVYKQLGNYQKALRYYQNALEIHEEIDDKKSIGNSLSNIGNIHQSLEDYLQALEYYQKSLLIHKKISDKHEQWNDLINIGMAYTGLKEYPKALEHFQQALEITKEIGNKHGEGIVLTNIGMVYKYLGEEQKVKNAFQDSVTIFETIGSVNLWLAQYGLASIEAELNQFELAIKYYEQSINNIEKIRTLLTEENKTFFMRNKIHVYDELIALLQSQHLEQPNKGYDRKAFNIFERKQGRLFLEEMGQSGVQRFAGLDNEIIEIEQSLAIKWQKVQSLSPLERTALEQAEEQLKNRIQAKHPKYYTLKYPQPVDLTTLQNQIL